MGEKNKNDKLTYVIMLGLGLVYYLLPGEWIGIEEDSGTYLSGKTGEGVRVGYPIFLAFFRKLFTERYFLHGVVIAQSLLAIVCTFLFVYILKKEFRLKRAETILLYVLSMLPFSIYLPEVGITHQIMTEGVTYAIFYLFMVTVIKAVWTLEYKWYLGSMSVAVLLGLIRSQMLFLQVVCFILLIWISIKRFEGKLVYVMGSFWLLVIGGILVFDVKVPILSQFDTVLIARGFYEADKEDVDLFEDDMMREIFTKTYQMVDEEKHLYKYATEGLYLWQDLVHDQIEEYAWEAINEYDTEHPGERGREEGSILRELGIKVMLKHFDRYLYHTVRLMISSFIASIFFQIRPIYLLCHFVTLFLYLFAIMACFTVRKIKGNRKVIELAVVILSVLVTMVVTVNLFYIGLQRYVVYGMGIFYCILYLLCREVYNVKKIGVNE